MKYGDKNGSSYWTATVYFHEPLSKTAYFERFGFTLERRKDKKVADVSAGVRNKSGKDKKANGSKDKDILNKISEFEEQMRMYRR